MNCSGKQPKILNLTVVGWPRLRANLSWSLSDPEVKNFHTQITYQPLGVIGGITTLLSSNQTSGTIEKLRRNTNYSFTVQTVDQCNYFGIPDTVYYSSDGGKIGGLMVSDIILTFFILGLWMYFVRFFFTEWNKVTYVSPKSGGYNIGMTNWLKSRGNTTKVEQMVERMHAPKLGSTGRQATTTSNSSRITRRTNASGNSLWAFVTHGEAGNASGAYDLVDVALVARNKWRSESEVNHPTLFTPVHHVSLSPRTTNKLLNPPQQYRVVKSETNLMAPVFYQNRTLLNLDRRQLSVPQSTPLNNMQIKRDYNGGMPRFTTVLRKPPNIGIAGSHGGDNKTDQTSTTTSTTSPTVSIAIKRDPYRRSYRKVSEVLMGSASKDVRRCQIKEEHTSLLLESEELPSRRTLESRRSEYHNTLNRSSGVQSSLNTSFSPQSSQENATSITTPSSMAPVINFPEPINQQSLLLVPYHRQSLRRPLHRSNAQSSGDAVTNGSSIESKDSSLSSYHTAESHKLHHHVIHPQTQLLPPPTEEQTPDLTML